MSGALPGSLPMTLGEGTEEPDLGGGGGSFTGQVAEAHRFILCDKSGVPLWNITSLVDGFKITELLSTPTALSFSVDPDDERLSGLHTDGLPYLEYIRRLVKYYRWEYVPSENRERYVHRYSGYVWPLDDSGDTETQITSVTCLDPLHIMAYRLARAADMSFGKVPFDTVQVGTILRSLVDRTNAISPTGLTTSYGIVETTPTAKVEWHLKMISEAISEMTARMDIAATPLDSTSGVHARLDVFAKRGQYRPNLRLAWNASPYTAEGVTRTKDPVDACTTLIGVGSVTSGAELQAIATDGDAALNWLHLEAVQTYSDVVDQNHLNALVTRDFLERRPSQEAITVKPVSDVQPWTHFETGDTCRITAGTALRGGIPERTERIMGFTYEVSGDSVEEVNVVTRGDDE